ncbi:MAG: tRNA 2-selenouridine(34) synthase MnmH [Gammaproteobacteria bacterium]|nr:tRNA 2-selenouridine(34) synthase MnmH [Gammaproteobacteria bacterium]
MLSVSDYAAALTRGAPLMDLRSPAEFQRGAFPGAVNLPLLTDAERERVGIRYKHGGQDAAIELGSNLVSGEVKAARLAAWQAIADGNPDAMLYCWRGGLRSETVQAWLADTGRHVPRIDGGYRALRRFCIDTLDRNREWLVVGGRTGVGKTDIVKRTPGSIDLESLANHRGSAFGKRATSQPTPISFENALAVQLLMRDSRPAPVVVEDESRTIGRLAIPERVYQGMQSAPIVLVELEQSTRIENIYREYVVEADGREGLQQSLETSLENIRRRLGGDRHGEVLARMRGAFEGGDADAHRAWIGMLLDWYYDPLYDYQIGGKRDRIVFQGNADAVCDYLRGTNR